VFGRTPTDAIITSLSTVPAGLLIVSVRMPVSTPADAADRNAMFVLVLKFWSLRP